MTFEKVAEILAEYKDMDAADIKPQSTFEELSLDSLDVVEIVMQLEDEFSVSLEVSPDLKKVEDVVALIDAEK